MSNFVIDKRTYEQPKNLKKEPVYRENLRALQVDNQPYPS